MDSTLIFIFITFSFLIFSALILWLTKPKPVDHITEDIDKNAERERERDPEGKRNLQYFYEAQKTLTLHFHNNLVQNKNIYRLTLIIIFAGFLMIGFGIWQISSLSEANINFSSLPWASILAGVITELIATTILIVYKSVFKQTIIYFQALERFSTVGMSIRILDDLADDTTTEELKSKIDLKKIDAKTAIAKLLIENMGGYSEKSQIEVINNE